ncbi:MAG: DegV family protein [Coriobacteriaceae bacterium]|nr:DegV family protein [Coriobacteriaceae bacterium]
MPNCNLIVDSCSDIPVEFIQKEGITLLKFPYFFGEQEFRDDLFQATSAKEFYDRMRAGEFPTTAQLPLVELIDTFTAVAKSGVPTVYLAFSSGLSKTFEVAQMAADQVRAKHPEMELYLVDSLTCAAGESLFLYEGIRQWEAGLSAKELADWAMEARWKVNMYFTVDSLDWLAHGGRMPSGVAFVGSKLNLKPIMYIGKDGAVSVSGATRGRKKSLAKLRDIYEEKHDPDSPYQQVFCQGGDCIEESDGVLAELRAAHPGLECYGGQTGPTIGTHGSPGVVLLAFWGPDRRTMK